MRIILASQSPRRRQLLEQIGLQFEVRGADIDETMDPLLPLETEIQRISLRKAEAVARNPGDVVIAADTMVSLDGKRLGKPRDAAQAFTMLRSLSGREHQVFSGVAVLRDDRAETDCVRTAIRFRALSDAEIRAYIATGEPMDKAGAYGIQGLACVFAEEIHGDYYNVMGLPVCRLAQMLRRFGVKILESL